MRYSARQVAQATGHNHETVRRYLLAGTLPADFLYAVCVVYDVCPRFLLLGIEAAGSRGDAATPLASVDSNVMTTATTSVAKVVVPHANRIAESQTTRC
jgi:hypothetical protein